MHRKCLQQSSSTHRKEGKLTCKPAIHVEVRNCTLCCFYARILMLPAIIGAISITIYKSHRCLWCTIFFPQQCYLIKISIPVTSAQNKGHNALTFYKVFFFFLPTKILCNNPYKIKKCRHPNGNMYQSRSTTMADINTVHTSTAPEPAPTRRPT